MIKTTITDKAPTKVCTKCGKEKPLGEFHKNKKGKYGYTPKCKKCYHDYQEANKEDIRKWQAIYYQENKERLNDINNQWVKKHPKRIEKIKKKSARKGLRFDTQTLSDRYIKRNLLHHGVRWGEITPELIEQKRTEIIYHRKLKELNNVIKQISTDN